MANEKRLIDANELKKNYTYLWDEALGTCECVLVEDIEAAPTVDAVPVDEIKFLYCAIDKNGIPALKIQLGDTIHCLRRENDPVDVVSVVRCKDCKYRRNEIECPMCFEEEKEWDDVFKK